MPTFSDPIELDNIEIDKNTCLYLVKLSTTETNLREASFAIKGVSCSIESLASCPTIHATNYWPIDVVKLLESYNKNEKDYSLIFPNDQLTTAPLSFENVKDYLGFEPDNTNAKKFNPDVGKALISEWGDDVVGLDIDNVHVEEVDDFDDPRFPVFTTSRLAEVDDSDDEDQYVITSALESMYRWSGFIDMSEPNRLRHGGAYADRPGSNGALVIDSINSQSASGFATRSTQRVANSSYEDSSVMLSNFDRLFLQDEAWNAHSDIDSRALQSADELDIECSTNGVESDNRAIMAAFYRVASENPTFHEAAPGIFDEVNSFITSNYSIIRGYSGTASDYSVMNQQIAPSLVSDLSVTNQRLEEIDESDDEELVVTHDFLEDLRRLQELIRAQPDNVSLRFDYINLLLTQPNYNFLVLLEYNNILQRDPDNITALLGRATWNMKEITGFDAFMDRLHRKRFLQDLEHILSLPTNHAVRTTVAQLLSELASSQTSASNHSNRAHAHRFFTPIPANRTEPEEQPSPRIEPMD